LIHTGARLKIIGYLSNPKIWKHIITLFLWMNLDPDPDPAISAISKSHDSAVGPDDIHYQMLKRLPGAALETLLDVLNDIWITGNFPESWRTVLKPGKDELDPSSYRPIALTSCICKIMERMINNSLVSYLEKHKLLSSVQCGFRKIAALLIILFALKHSFARLLSNGNTLLPSSLTCEKLMTQHGNIES